MAFKTLITLAVLLTTVSSLSFSSYFLSLGIFAPSEAEALHRRLTDKGYQVYLLYGEDYEVRIGGCKSRDKATEIVAKLKRDEKIISNVFEEEDIDRYQVAVDSIDTDKKLSSETSRIYTDLRAKKIISLALDLFGHPYTYGGTRIGKGIDCSFFVQTIFQEFSIALPRTSGEQFRVGKKVEKKELKVGDMLFFEKTYFFGDDDNSKLGSVTRINHVGIYIGGGEFIHATRNVMHVTISRLDENYYTKRFAGARRVLAD